MELMNCRNCKRLFNYITGEKICPKCKEMLEEKFQEVKLYIKDNPGKNIAEVAEECDTTVKQIKKWVREERLSFTDDSLVGLECERCGKMIHSGRFCKDCAGGLADAMQDAYRQAVIRKKPSGSAAGKMRFLE
ncbi:MAG: flagellar protein [Wujia sp.]